MLAICIWENEMVVWVEISSWKNKGSRKLRSHGRRVITVTGFSCVSHNLKLLRLCRPSSFQ